MPVVEVSELIAAPVQKVWDVVNDVESYPRLMDHVRSVEVRERGSNYRLTAWRVDLKGCVMRWVEREEIDPERYRIEYRAVEGDLAELDGYWQLEPMPNETCRATVSVRFEIGIPMLSEMLNPVAERAIGDNSRKMLLSLASQATQDIHETTQDIHETT